MSYSLARQADARDEHVSPEPLKSVEGLAHGVPPPLRVPLYVFVDGERYARLRLIVRCGAGAVRFKIGPSRAQPGRILAANGTGFDETRHRVRVIPVDGEGRT